MLHNRREKILFSILRSSSWRDHGAIDVTQLEQQQNFKKACVTGGRHVACLASSGSDIGVFATASTAKLQLQNCFERYKIDLKIK